MKVNSFLLIIVVFETSCNCLSSYNPYLLSFYPSPKGKNRKLYLLLISLRVRALPFPMKQSYKCFLNYQINFQIFLKFFKTLIKSACNQNVCLRALEVNNLCCFQHYKDKATFYIKKSFYYWILKKNFVYACAIPI